MSKRNFEDLRVTAHSVRSVASSWAVMGGASVNQVMNACSWRSENTFSTFYLQEAAWEHDKTFSIGPFIAAQAEVDPKKSKSIKKK